MAPSPSPTAETEPKIKHDNKYYFQADPMAIFFVENSLFRIHRHFLIEESEVFRGMFVSPAEGSGPEGKSDEQPILLPEVTKGEFQALLDYFYLPPHAQHMTDGGAGHLQTYTDLLSISHRFLFDKVFQYAVGKLQPVMKSVPAAQRFTLGQKYGLKEWTFSAYETLLDRETTPTAQELEILGFDKAARLMEARNAMHQRHLRDIKAKCQCTEKDKGANVPTPTPPHLIPWTSVAQHGQWSVTQHRQQTVAASPPVVKPVARPFVQQFFEC